jgi:predicted PurR-regulated permease PerM
VVILVPVVFLSVSLANEANDAFQQLKDPATLHKIQLWFAPGGAFLTKIQGWLPASIQLDKLQIGERISTQAQQIGIGALGLATAFAAGIFGVLVDYFLMSTVLFFLLRDFDYFARSARLISPLSNQQEELFVERFRKVTRATVIGNLVTALTQGSISGLLFLILGLPNFVLWGALTALLSLVPLVGTALIWVPWTIYLFVVGSPVKATIFLIFQIVVVGGIDNILRPLLIEGSVKMHTLLVFFSILGGIGYFGILGMFFGPLIFAGRFDAPRVLRPAATSGALGRARTSFSRNIRSESDHYEFVNLGPYSLPVIVVKASTKFYVSDELECIYPVHAKENQQLQTDAELAGDLR